MRQYGRSPCGVGQGRRENSFQPRATRQMQRFSCEFGSAAMVPRAQVNLADRTPDALYACIELFGPNRLGLAREQRACLTTFPTKISNTRGAAKSRRAALYAHHTVKEGSHEQGNRQVVQRPKGLRLHCAGRRQARTSFVHVSAGRTRRHDRVLERARRSLSISLTIARPASPRPPICRPSNRPQRQP